MENSKVKALFFAQYLYQNVACSQGYNSPIPLNHIQQGTDEWLLLRTINQITDDEAIEIAAFMGFKNGTNAAACRSLILTLFVIKSNDPIKYELISKQFLFDFMDIIVIGDKLRSYGILIPFMDLSVDKIIELGWAKTQQP